jgi:hypothetical protein
MVCVCVCAAGWLFHDALELLPATGPVPTPSTPSRYEHFLSVFGEEVLVRVAPVALRPMHHIPPAPLPSFSRQCQKLVHAFVLHVVSQEKLKASKTFLVGCGALGCEFLKNFAM